MNYSFVIAARDEKEPNSGSLCRKATSSSRARRLGRWLPGKRSRGSSHLAGSRAICCSRLSKQSSKSSQGSSQPSSRGGRLGLSSSGPLPRRQVTARLPQAHK